MNWNCDVCDGSLIVGSGGRVLCTACGIEHSAERVQEKLNSLSVFPEQLLDSLLSEPEEAPASLFIKAFEVILENKSASASLLQRKLKIGYAQAARLLDEMEEKKMISPYAGSSPRKVYITAEQWEVMKKDLR